MFVLNKPGKKIVHVINMFLIKIIYNTKEYILYIHVKNTVEILIKTESQRLVQHRTAKGLIQEKKKKNRFKTR